MKTKDFFSIAIIGAVFFAVGDFSPDIIKWIVCIHSDLVRLRQCHDSAEAEAMMIGTLFATSLAVLSAAYAGHRRIMSNKDTRVAVTVALVAAFFGLMKSASEGATYPQVDLLSRPAYMYAVFVSLFALPWLISRQMTNSNFQIFQLFVRTMVALLLGALIGYLFQLIVEIGWSTASGQRWGAQKFVVAPSAIAIACGAWATILLDPFLRQKVWKGHERLASTWVVMFALVAVVLALGYATIFYLFDGQFKVRNWIEAANLSGIAIVILFTCLLTIALLILVGLSQMGINLERPSGIAQACFATAGGSFVAAGAWVWVTFPANEPVKSSVDMAWFMTSHGLAGASVPMTCLIGNRISNRFTRAISG